MLSTAGRKQFKSTGRGYKIKNVKYGLYLTPHSTQPENGTVIGASPNQPPKTWSIMRTHDGFTIEYGEDGVEIDLPYGLDKLSNTMHLWFILPNSSSHRWKFEKLSDEVGGEAAETFEDRIAALSDQLQKAGVEIAAKDQLLAQKEQELQTAKDQLLAQKEQELQSALKSRREVPVKAIEAQLAELRQKIEGLEFLVKSYATIRRGQIIPVDLGILELGLPRHCRTASVRWLLCLGVQKTHRTSDNFEIDY
ncbi:hypothetical protein RSAG8_00762, partial [Rhizoctonia solani AG-8 WAC10335]